MDSLNEIFANRLPRFYHKVNPTAEMVPVQIYIVDDLYEKQCELRPDRDPDLIPNGNGYNGITVVPHLVDDPINILFDINKIKQYSEDGSMTWVGTFGHEYTHAIDFYQMAKREALDSYDPLEETDKYYLFQMWTEYHARKKGYGFLRAFFNVDSDSDSRGERLQHIQEIEWPFHENRFYTEYHEKGVDQIYLTMQLLGRYSVWCDVFPKEFNVDTFTDHFWTEPWLYHLFDFMRNHETLERIYTAFDEMRDILSENWIDIESYQGK